MKLYMSFYRKSKKDPHWIVALGLKRSPESWVLCGYFCDN